MIQRAHQNKTFVIIFVGYIIAILGGAVSSVWSFVIPASLLILLAAALSIATFLGLRRAKERALSLALALGAWLTSYFGSIQADRSIGTFVFLLSSAFFIVALDATVGFLRDNQETDSSDRLDN